LRWDSLYIANRLNSAFVDEENHGKEGKRKREEEEDRYVLS
jgi:hypothetical protein